MPRNPERASAPRTVAAAASAPEEKTAAPVEWAVAALFFLYPILFRTPERPVLGYLFVPDADRRLLAALAAAAILVLGALRGRGAGGPALPAIAYPLFLAASATWAASPLRALERAGETGTLLALGALAWSALDGERSRERALVSLLFGFAAAGAFGIAQKLGLGPAWCGGRAVATFGNTNAAAEAQALAVALGAGLLARRPSIGAGVATAVSLAHLVLTRGRGGLVAAAVAIGVAVLLGPRDPARARSRRAAIAAAAAAAFLLLAVSGGFSVLAERAASLADPEFPSHRVRLRILEGTLRMIGDSPVLGVGAGHFRVAFPPYRSHEERRLSGPLSEVENAHDDWAEAWAETGPLGFAFFAALLAAAFVPLARRSRADEGSIAPALAPAVAAFAVAALFRSPLANPSALLVLSVASAAAVSNAAPARRWPARGLAFAPLVLLGLFFASAHEIAASRLSASEAAERLGDRVRAAESAARASAAVPWDDRAANWHAHRERVAGRRPEAIAALGDVLARNANHVLARIGLSAELAASGDDGAAIAVLEDARRIAPWEPQVHEALARRREKSDPAAAREHALLAGLLDPKASPPWETLLAILSGKGGALLPASRRESLRQTASGAIALAHGDGAEADLRFRAAALADIDSPEPHFFFAIRSVEKGEIEAAKTSLRAARRALPPEVEPAQEPLLRKAAVE